MYNSKQVTVIFRGRWIQVDHHFEVVPWPSFGIEELAFHLKKNLMYSIIISSTMVQTHFMKMAK